MPVLWIHRAFVSDLRVEFYDLQDAYNFGKEVLENSKEELVEISDCDEWFYSNTGSFVVGYSTSMQVSIEKDSFVPEEGWDYWNEKGCVRVTQEDVKLLLC